MKKKPLNFSFLLHNTWEEYLSILAYFCKKKNLNKKNDSPLQLFVLLVTADEILDYWHRFYNNNQHIYPVRFTKNELSVKNLEYIIVLFQNANT